MHLDFSTKQGKKVITCLVDTGAQICLVNSRSFAPSLYELTKNPVRLVSADGSRMQGGDRVIKGELDFLAVPRKPRQPPSNKGSIITSPFQGYCANIAYDIILSHPWLHGMGMWVATPYSCLFREYGSVGDEFILGRVDAASEPRPDEGGGGPEFGSTSVGANRILVRGQEQIRGVPGPPRDDPVMMDTSVRPKTGSGRGSGGGLPTGNHHSLKGSKHSSHDPIEGEAGIASSANLWSILAPSPKKAKRKGAYKHRKRQQLLKQLGTEFALHVRKFFEPQQNSTPPISTSKEKLEIFSPLNFVETPNSSSSTSPTATAKITSVLGPGSIAEGFGTNSVVSDPTSPDGHIKVDAVLFPKSTKIDEKILASTASFTEVAASNDDENNNITNKTKSPKPKRVQNRF